MARGPRGEKRPNDPAAAAVLAVRIATGEVEERLDESVRQKDPAAVALGKRGGLKGGKRRAEQLSSERKKEIARMAAEARWKEDGK